MLPPARRPPDTPQILVVDDDPDITTLLSQYLAGHGYAVRTARDGAALRTAMEALPADLVLLDLGLPGEDGLNLARHLRESTAAGVIIVTGRGSMVDRIVGLEIGADDYITKPFDLRELLARVRSVLRRLAERKAPAAGALRFSGFRLEPDARRLLDAAGGEVDLTTGEFDLLSVFAAHPHQVLSRDALLDLTRHRPGGPFDRAIDVQVGRLRRKIEPDPARPSLIKAVRGAGYLFAADVCQEP